MMTYFFILLLKCFSSLHNTSQGPLQLSIICNGVNASPSKKCTKRGGH